MEIDRWDKWEDLTISNDFMFSKVMRDKEICRETLEILLGKKIGEIEYVENQKVIDISYDSKSVRLDVYVEDENRIYNVEMQVVHNKDLARRSRYYQGMIDLNAIEKGEMYRELKESIIIFICRFDPFGRGMSRYTFENICVEDGEIHLGDGTSKIFFNTKGYVGGDDREVKYFLEYVESNESNLSEFVRKIEEKIRDIKDNKEWRAEYMNLLMREREIARDSFEKGRLKGINEGIREGRLEGIAEGEERGIKRLVNTCRRLGASEEDIITSLFEEYGLSEEEARKYL